MEFALTNSRDENDAVSKSFLLSSTASAVPRTFSIPCFSKGMKPDLIAVSASTMFTDTALVFSITKNNILIVSFFES